MNEQKILEQKPVSLPHEIALLESVTRRIPEFEKNWEDTPMDLYRKIALNLVSQHFVHPKKGDTETLFEYGAGIGRITREIVRLPYIQESRLSTHLIANDLAPKVLEKYEKSVAHANPIFVFHFWWSR